MGLLQKAVQTYDAHSTLVGVIRAEHQPLAPICHLITNADIEVTVDEKGGFVEAVLVDKANAKTIIPATEESAGRTSAPCAHPLCDQVGYLSGNDTEKFELYTRQLSQWANSQWAHPMLKPILNYVEGKTLLTDLGSQGIEKPGEKSLIRWRVVGIGEQNSACWMNQELFQSFIDWYTAQRKAQGKTEELCMITGQLAVVASQHPKGIIPINGNAKLISANDNANFTYRGRFLKDWQAASVSYIASQKAHNALRWLAAEQGVRVIFGGRTFLCWNPQGRSVPHAVLPFTRTGIGSVTPTDYRASLRRTLEGYRTELPENSGGIVIAAFDAATTGRLALTYYNELRESDFLERLFDWDVSCCWWTWNTESGRYDAVQSPPLWQIVNCAYGTQREEKKKIRLVTDDRVMKQQMQRLVSCRVDRAVFPEDIFLTLVHRASMPQAFDSGVYRLLLQTACAVIRKYHLDHFKEDVGMVLQENKVDRSYQFGRLLAVLEGAERSSYGKDENRETNAIRLHSVYCRRPLHTATIVEAQLERAYFSKIRSRSPGLAEYYKNLIGEILGNIQKNVDQAQWDRPLEDTYLIGYYHQRSELYKSKDKNVQEEQ